jgi:hypothetical protein
VLAVADPASWNGYVDQLAAAADVEIAGYDDLIAVLIRRHDLFHRAGCRLSAHSLAGGLLPRDFDLVGDLVADVCFRNAASFFGFELP